MALRSTNPLVLPVFTLNQLIVPLIRGEATFVQAGEFYEFTCVSSRTYPGLDEIVSFRELS